MSDKPILEVKNLSVHFKTGIGKNKIYNKAVDKINFSINKGEVFSLVGESGCGKTTTGRTIIRLYKPTEGEIYFKGKRVSSGINELLDNRKAIVDNNKDDKNRKKENISEALKKIDKEIVARKNDNSKNNFEMMKKVQMIFQDPIDSLDPRMTVKEIIAEGLSYREELIQAIEKETGVEIRRIDVDNNEEIIKAEKLCAECIDPTKDIVFKN
jgi:ABC-type oligopeptide transport system ATPase subunit